MSEIGETLQDQIREAMKVSMKAGKKQELGVIRLMMAAIRQREIDDRVSLDDAGVMGVLDKMIKQSRESVKQYRSAGRDDLAHSEEGEIRVIQGFLPSAFAAEEVDHMVRSAIEETGAKSVRDMGKVMASLKPKMQGRADMATVSLSVKQLLNSS